MYTNTSALRKEPVTDIHFGPAPLKVLILDDSSFDRFRLRRLLLRGGLSMDIDEISCLHQLAPMLRHNVYDLIILDYFLPDGTGEEALDMVLADEAQRDAKTIMVSGNPWQQSKELHRKTTEFLLKDDLTITLQPLLDRLLERRIAT